MTQNGRSNAVARALYVNAAVLLAILIVLCRGRADLTTPAFAEPTQAPIAGGAGTYVMPCQFHPNVWGCYLLDVDRQTLCAYEYRSGEKTLVLTAARHFRYDTQLKNFDTFPAWYDVQKLAADQDDSQRRADSKAPVLPAAPAPQQ